MIIKLANRELPVLDTIPDILPSGVTRLTNRNPNFNPTLESYSKLIQDAIRYKGLELDSPEVSALFAVKQAIPQGFIVEFIR